MLSGERGALRAAKILSGALYGLRRFDWLGAGCLGDVSGAVRLRRSPPLFRAVFADGLFLREPIRENHECATDGCTVGHLYLSQMIFGQGDPWSLV